jgi:hypothetical protein
MVRTDEQYLADIRAVLRRFYRPGDVLYLVRFFNAPQKCQMCGNMVDIWHCYELQNQRSGERIICGCNCIVKYATVLRTMDQAPVILFPDKFREHAEKINKRLPGTVVLEPCCAGLDEEAGWDLCDCGVELSYCEDCDNEVCPECERGCTCDAENPADQEYWEDDACE